MLSEPYLPRESRQVLEELAATNKLNRVLPTRMVHRYKPGELPGEASSRLGSRGFASGETATRTCSA